MIKNEDNLKNLKLKAEIEEYFEIYYPQPVFTKRQRFGILVFSLTVILAIFLVLNTQGGDSRMKIDKTKEPLPAIVSNKINSYPNIDEFDLSDLENNFTTDLTSFDF